MQRLAEALGPDAPQAFRKMATWGARGKSNCWRDFLRRTRSKGAWRGLDVGLTHVRLPTRRGKKLVWLQWPVIAPAHYINGLHKFQEWGFIFRAGRWKRFWWFLRRPRGPPPLARWCQAFTRGIQELGFIFGAGCWKRFWWFLRSLACAGGRQAFARGLCFFSWWWPMLF